jgi:hypothetical protein
MHSALRPGGGARARCSFRLDAIAISERDRIGDRPAQTGRAAAAHRPALPGTDVRGASSSPTILGAGTGGRLRRGFAMPLTATASGGMATPALVPKLPVYQCQRRPNRGPRAFGPHIAEIEGGLECERCAPLLGRLADGAGGAGDLGILRRHLRTCLNCRARLKRLRRTGRERRQDTVARQRDEATACARPSRRASAATVAGFN